MGDREPRRRKKRRESHKKEEVRSDAYHTFITTKAETLDSDPDVEEEIVIPSYETSNMSKFVFIILFSSLVVSLSFIFISLQGADRGPVDIFDVTHDDNPSEVLHDDHPSEVLHDDHSEEVPHDDHSDHEDEVKLEDLIPGISSLGSIFSLNNEQVKDSEIESMYEDEQKEKRVEVPKEVEPEISTDQGILEEYIEESVDQYAPDSIIEETPLPDIYTSATPLSSYSEDESTYSTPDYSESDFTTPYTPPDRTEPDDEPVTPYKEPEDMSTVSYTAFEDDVEDSFSFYEKSDITNEADYKIRDQLDEMDSGIERSPDKVLAKCEELLKYHPQSPRLLYVRAQVLDRLAEIHRSNKYLEEAIATYKQVMSCENVPERLYLIAGRRAADRLRFRGFTGKSVKLLTEMSVKFPTEVALKNEVAVGYLLIGQNQMAKHVLLDVLRLDPNSGIAKVHLGFILKTDESNYEESIRYLMEGIASKESGVIDGRFYFHLGDALHRTGKEDEAVKVYEEAVKEGLFFSVYQRSLYNVNGLTGRPWWDPKSTHYAPDFKILEKNWIIIRDEALSLINENYSSFMPEAEGLQETGEWKQLELFARGRKLEQNCQKAPKTCSIISQIPDAASCKRGQVKFSIMHPKTHVWAHTGPTNCRLRAHLGLVVPENVNIRVADETKKWEEGKVILFDDSFEHEVWHNGSSYRLVLIVDFWHPELTSYQKRSLTPI